jgi:hypothetical protein
MAANKLTENNELKKRFDTFHREARYQDKPYRMLGRPQVTNKQVSILIAYPAFENAADKEAFPEIVGNQLKEYGLEPSEVVRQKSAVRILARLLISAANTEKGDEG